MISGTVYAHYNFILARDPRSCQEGVSDQRDLWSEKEVASMNHLSYGHECIIYLLATMSASYLFLDVFPALFQRLRKAFVTAPIPAGAAFILMVSAYFLL